MKDQESIFLLLSQVSLDRSYLDFWSFEEHLNIHLHIITGQIVYGFYLSNLGNYHKLIGSALLFLEHQMMSWCAISTFFIIDCDQHALS